MKMMQISPTKTMPKPIPMTKPNEGTVDANNIEFILLSINPIKFMVTYFLSFCNRFDGILTNFSLLSKTVSRFAKFLCKNYIFIK